MTIRPLACAADGPPDAPVLVLSSSLGTTGEMWEPQMPLLAATWRVLRVDYPGHGASPLPEGSVTVPEIGSAILDLLDDQGHDEFSFCGLSLGGAIGQWIAAHAPQRVGRLILCSTVSHFDPETYLQRADTVRQEGLGQVAKAVMDRWFTPQFRAREPEIVARYRTMVEGVSPQGYAACAQAVARFDSRPYLDRITAPTLVLVGAEDPVVPSADAGSLADAIPGARLEVVERAAHLLNVEQAEVTSRAMVRHLGGDQHD
jgi:3-oxoadipate enol-lactonase